MELHEIQSFIEDSIDEDENVGLDLLIAITGKFTEARLTLDEHNLPGEQRKAVLGEILAGMVSILAHMAVEEGIDLDEAMQERMDNMRQEREERKDIEEMIEEADYEGLAQAMGLAPETKDEPDDRRMFG